MGNAATATVTGLTASSTTDIRDGSMYSLETHDTATTMDMDLDDDFVWNSNSCNGLNGRLGSPDALNPMDDSFNMIGFNDDFSTFGVMGALSRNSSGPGTFKEMNGGLNLKSSFSDNFPFPE